MLRVEHITTGYGKKQVLTDVSFEVNEGAMVLLTGGNGSGKSTVLKTIYGLLKTWMPEGKIIFNGEDITALPTALMLRKGIAYLPQKKNVFEDFTVEENLLTYPIAGQKGLSFQSDCFYPRRHACRYSGCTLCALYQLF